MDYFSKSKIQTNLDIKILSALMNILCPNIYFC